MTNTLTLPWPPKECSPNARVHWTKKAKVAKAYRDECFLLAKAAKLQAPCKTGLHLWIEFYPPNKQRRDVDNAHASAKNGLDGMCAAIGIDDSVFKDVHLHMSQEVGGVVKIRLTNGSEIAQ